MIETELVARVERLERDNRRFKRLAVAALLIAAAIGTMAATRPVPQKIVAHEFDVVGASGKVRIRLSVAKTTGYAEVDLVDQEGNPQLKMYTRSKIGPWLVLRAPGPRVDATQMALDVGTQMSTISMFDRFGRSAKLEVGGTSKQWGMDQLLFHDGDGDVAISTMFSPTIQLRDKAEVNRVELGIGGPTAVAKALGGLEVGNGGYLGLWDGNDKLRFLADDSPRIELGDANGYTAAIGRMDLVTPATGETHRTSAASILLFGNGKKRSVIWQAP